MPKVVEQVLTRDLHASFRLDGGWVLRNVDIQKAGTEIILDASLDAQSPDTSWFRLIFKNCRYTSWDVTQAEYQETSGYEVADFDLYDNPEGKEAVINTPQFELMITYGELLIQYEES